MKGRKEHRNTGGRNDAAEDVDRKTPMRVNAPEIDAEANEKKRGGRTERRRGGVVHHEKMEHMKHAKHVGPVHGKRDVHAGRAPRKSGGRASSNRNPFSSAHAGTPARGHKTTDID